jgi:hypothetical protein
MPVCVIIQLSSSEEPLCSAPVLTVIGLLKSMGHICTVSQGALVLAVRRVLAGISVVSALVALVSEVSVAHGDAPTTPWHRHQIPLACGSNRISFLLRMRAEITWYRLDFRLKSFIPMKMVSQFRHHLHRHQLHRHQYFRRNQYFRHRISHRRSVDNVALRHQAGTAGSDPGCVVSVLDSAVVEKEAELRRVR